MSKIKGSLQTLSSTSGEHKIETGLTVDGRAGWNIIGFKVVYPDFYLTPLTANNSVTVSLNTETGAQWFLDNDNIATLYYQIMGVAASSAALSVSPERIADFSPRLTVQPELIVRADMSVSGTKLFWFEVEYEIVKLTDLEVMRMLQGGA